jgi:hypothetical protein
MQNIYYTIDFLDKIEWNLFKSLVDNIITIVIFLVIDIIIAYFLILRNYFIKEKKLKSWERVILCLSLLIYITDVSLGFSAIIGSKIEDKKTYEVINNNKVIVEVYDGKYLIMNCEVENNNLIIHKGMYSFIEMTGIEIKYHEYKNVTCN